jgi:hypothetical protein
MIMASILLTLQEYTIEPQFKVSQLKIFFPVGSFFCGPSQKPI